MAKTKPTNLNLKFRVKEGWGARVEHLPIISCNHINLWTFVYKNYSNYHRPPPRESPDSEGFSGALSSNSATLEAQLSRSAYLS
ncbi:hypothetical protein BB560_001680 [Smittium megazygosporum]|uniref:Uncharacterized protein n=1 Tax=Smittium megazygosporum TaxID=133381 RepID=A0A2T9ZGU5_9FUNG|nr:hypothetical protein BB560_001680 [Smittium megazygosporum]